MQRLLWIQCKGQHVYPNCSCCQLNPQGASDFSCTHYEVCRNQSLEYTGFVSVNYIILKNKKHSVWNAVRTKKVIVLCHHPSILRMKVSVMCPYEKQNEHGASVYRSWSNSLGYLREMNVLGAAVQLWLTGKLGKTLFLAASCRVFLLPKSG